jgi:predicted transcriptional regulator
MADMARKGRSGQAKLTAEQARDIILESGHTAKDALAAKYGVSLSTIYNVLKGASYAEATQIVRTSLSK